MPNYRDVFRDQLNTFICADNLSVIRQWPDKSVPMYFFSAPYNLGNTSGGGAGSMWQKSTLLNKGYANHDDNMPEEDYTAWQRDILAECMRTLTDDGVIFYNHKHRMRNKMLWTPERILDGFPRRLEIVLRFPSAINYNRAGLAPVTERLYVICNRGFDFTREGVKLTDVWDLKRPRSDHPAPFSPDIVEKALLATGKKLVVDIFMGSGSTAVAARKCGVHWIGIDNAPEYIQMARERYDWEFKTPKWQKWFQTFRTGRS